MSLKPYNQKLVSASPAAQQVMTERVRHLLQPEDWLYYELHGVSKRTAPAIALITQQHANVRLPPGPDVTREGWLPLNDLGLTVRYLGVHGTFCIFTEAEAPPEDNHS